MSDHLIDAEKVEEIFMGWVHDLVINHGEKSVAQVLTSPAIQSMFTGEVGQSVMAYPQCSLCNIPLATGTCTHVLITGKGQVTMTETAWKRLVAEVNTQRDEPEPTAYEVGGVRIEYGAQAADAVRELAAAVRFHAILGNAQHWTAEDINIAREHSRES